MDNLDQINIKESQRKKSLGELGELFAIKTLVDCEFDKIRNLNDDNINEPFADILCEKDGQRFVISVKARNKFQLDGRLNSRYNIGSNVYESAKNSETRYQAKAYWMAIQFDLHEYSVFFGSLDSLKGSKGIPISKCEKGQIGTVLVKKKRHYFDFSYYKNIHKRNLTTAST